MNCINCNNSFEDSELVEVAGRAVCAECKPLLLKQIQEGTASTSFPYAEFSSYAGFWIRTLARFIDGMLISVVFLPVVTALYIAYTDKDPSFLDYTTKTQDDLLFSFLIGVLGLVVGGSYEVFFLIKKGGTLGKLALKLQVVDENGERLTLKKAIKRFMFYSGQPLTLIPYVAEVLNFVISIGYIAVGIDKEKRAIHDRICKTRVVVK